MECIWDAALLKRRDELPPELLQVIENADPARYLQSITKTSLDARYTYTLLAHCRDIFPHVSATLRSHGDLASSIATLGRVVPFAPHLTIYATHLLEAEQYDFDSSRDDEEHLPYLLGLFRLFAFNDQVFRNFTQPHKIAKLLQSQCRPVVYLSIRILQVYLNGADAWFEDMVRQYLGADSEDTAILGQWDDKTIDYRFLTLWEEDRFARVCALLNTAQNSLSAVDHQSRRKLPATCFHPSIALIAGTLLPRSSVEPRNTFTTEQKLISTHTTDHNLRILASALKDTQPILVTGLPGSGKSSLVRHIAQTLGKDDSMVTLHLNEQSDAKLLIGIYTTGDTPGSFVWRPGVLTTAVQEGRWVLIEDLDRAPREIIGTLLPLIESRQLLISNTKQTIYAHPDFKIIATLRTAINHRGEETGSHSHMLGRRHWQNVAIKMPSTPELRQIAAQLHPSLASLLPQVVRVYERLQSAGQRVALAGGNKTGVLRSVSPRDLYKWCRRINSMIHQRTSFTSTDIDDIFLSAIDCFVGALPDSPARKGMTDVVAEELHIDPQRRDCLLHDREVNYQSGKQGVIVGRYQFSHQMARAIPSSTFSINPHTARMLERVAAAVTNREPLLLIGETGVGKTTAVQHLATNLGKKLVPFNLSQQSEAGDLLGGFKPVSVRSLIVPLKEDFDVLFSASFSLSKNQQFLGLLGKQMARGNWTAVCKIWREAFKMVEQHRPKSETRHGANPSKKRRIESRDIDFAGWDTFRDRVSSIEQRLKGGDQAFAFSFVEGNIVKAARNGDWVLLDEINLASPDTLESIADLFDSQSPSLLLAEAGNAERVDAHPEFRIFAAMNPATDVGKKDLPPGIRSRFTEIYVESPDKDIKSLQSIVRSYLRQEVAGDQAVALDTSVLYQVLIKLVQQNKIVDGAGQMPHFSLRTLTRTLSYAKEIAPLCSLRRALYEGFQMSFLTLLDAESVALVQPLLEQHLLAKRTNVRAELQRSLRKPDGDAHLQGFPGSKHWMRQGDLPVEDQPDYILTPFIRSNLENLVRATSTRKFPVLIQGPTSSGKTSMIEYLAKRTGHRFVRINNHEHTDLQEYLGTYISDINGRLHFQEGLLVQALRHGHWIVLDELNLAPTDVLEALNRLLDDNRELLIPETQEVVRPHHNFMLFATQNPAGLYGGRKILSRAFRNRFLELHFDDIPIDELHEILHRRTQLPESRCRRIVAVYKELSALRQENRLFEQKSFATLRDLFRWAWRPNDTIEQLAANGFMLLAERVRKPMERQTLKEVIERVMSKNGPRVVIDEATLYSRSSAEVSRYDSQVRGSGVVWTKAMRRLYVLVSRAVANNEPVLLVGDTGSGKTTVCQMLADAFGKELNTVNAHQNTETGDLIGSQRPVRDRAVIEANLRHQLLSMPLLQNLDTGGAHSTDALLQTYDNAVNSLAPAQREAHCASVEHLEVQALRMRFKSLFEWADGSLVHAMRHATFFLLDEISLADDSVLERINSVLEPGRSILLAEKGSLDSYVTAATGFQFFATMNPGGDYGKKELSPALRNRFTEIWVPALDGAEDIEEIVNAKLVDIAKGYGQSMVAFAQWFNNRYNTSASSSISIRDVLAWVRFVNKFANANLAMSLVHGAAMVYLDTLGANPAGMMALSRGSIMQERAACLERLSQLLGLDSGAVYYQPVEIDFAQDQVNVGPYSLPRRPSEMHADLSFSFRPLTTQVNLMRVVRAMQVSKPVLLEGSPGVGKTALVAALAQAVSCPLTRINLSEQTDLLDLFGSDVPVEDGQPGTFAWRDAPFLRAMKAGEWVLLDELNLASQSVLEGLNACLDHRGEVFVPELGQTFTRHSDFRVFAAQNPHHQGGGRKGLPASFVNRFTVVYADSFSSDDLMLICKQSHVNLDEGPLRQAVQLMEALEVEVNTSKKIGAAGGPWEFNLRDLNKFLSLVSAEHGFLKAGSAQDFAGLVFSQRFRSPTDQNAVLSLVSHVFRGAEHVSDLFPSLSPRFLQIGLAALQRSPREATFPELTPEASIREHDLRTLQSLMICVQQNWPVILTGPSGSGKSALVHDLASLVGASVVTLAMNAETDAMDLLGGYEQADPRRHSMASLQQLRTELVDAVKDMKHAAQLPELLEALITLDSVALGEVDARRLTDVLHTLGNLGMTHAPAMLHDVLLDSNALDQGRFEWIDGLLIEALEQGKWLILDNANLCSSSVLDRLNSLLEPHGTLVMSEHNNADGTPGVIRPHPDFRIFMLLDPQYGELSRAMRNRAIELYVLDFPDSLISRDGVRLHSESTIARFRQAKLLQPIVTEQLVEPGAVVKVFDDHLALQDAALIARFKQQISIGLYRSEPSYVNALSSVSGRMLSQHTSELASLYRSLVDLSQAPTDFVSIQTLHPLNNQALVLCSPQESPSAWSLAFAHEADLRITAIHTAMVSMEKDKRTLASLRRLEQSVGLAVGAAKSQASTSSIMTVMKVACRGLSLWLESRPVLPWPLLITARRIVGDLCTLCHFGLALIESGSMSSSQFVSFLVAGQALTRSMLPLDTHESLSLGVREIQQSLAALVATIQGGKGRACIAFWNSFALNIPTTREQLDELLTFESAVSSFDRASQRLDQPLDHMAELRLLTARALQSAPAHGRELVQLTSKFDSLSSTSQTAESTKSATPHFHSVYRSLCNFFSVLMLDESVTLPPMDLARLSLLACSSTKEGIDRYAVSERTSWEAQFGLLAASTGSVLEPDKGEHTNVLQCLDTTGNVSLGRMDLLKTELNTLGATVASQAHLLRMNETEPLDMCLERMFVTMLKALSQSAGDASLEELGRQTLQLLAKSADDSTTTTTTESLTQLFQEVVAYLGFATHHPAQNNPSQCARAWASLACAGLRLYVSKIAYDPAMVESAQQEMHQQQSQDLFTRLNAFNAFRVALTGTSKHLRVKLLANEVRALGPAPRTRQAYRPAKSQIAELQPDLDALTRALEPVVRGLEAQDDFLPLSPILLNNLVNVRGRLLHQHRAYDDFKLPIVGFIDCLLTAHRLSIVANESQRSQAGPRVSALLPFVGGSLEAFLDDAVFVDANASSRTQAEGLCWTHLIALRSRTRPMVECSQPLRTAVQQRFHEYYTQWRTQLQDEQRETMARSSLYKFKGQSDDQDPTQEDVDEYFPVGDVMTNEQSPKQDALQPEDLAFTIAQFHQSVFSDKPADQSEGLLALLRQLPKVYAPPPSWSQSQDMMAPLILLISDQRAALQENGNTAYDIYRNANPLEARRLLAILGKAVKRFQSIHEVWPEHATPVEVARLCEDLSSISHSAPLTRFMPKLEKLHGTIYEWQKIASREYSAADIYEELTNLLVSWRQLELSSWAGLFDREKAECERSAASWWYIAYEAIIVGSMNADSSQDLTRHAGALLNTLRDFLTSCALGEFSTRLQLLRAFGSHLRAGAIDQPPLGKIYEALINVVNYYATFEHTVNETLSKKQSQLEKEVKDIIRLASWKDRNIDVLRQSAQSSHKRLLRLVKKYRGLLAQPVEPIIYGDFPARTADRSALGVEDSWRPTRTPPDLEAYRDNKALDKRLVRLINTGPALDALVQRVDQMQHHFQAPQKVKAFTDDLTESIGELQRATPTVLKDENQALLNHLKTRKRRLLADVLKGLRQMGFQATMNQTAVADQSSTAIVLAALPTSNHDVATSSHSGVQYEFHRFLHAIPKARQSAAKASPDLTKQEVARCSTLLESILQLSVEQYGSSLKGTNQLHELDKAMRPLRALTVDKALVVQPFDSARASAQAVQVALMEPVLQTSLKLLSLQQDLSGKDYSELADHLRQSLVQLAVVRSSIEESSHLAPNLRNANNESPQAQLNVLLQDVNAAARQATSKHPEIHIITEQLAKWLTKHDLTDTESLQAFDLSQWTEGITSACDIMLSRTQDMFANRIDEDQEKPDARWLVAQSRMLQQHLQSLDLDSMTNMVDGFMSQITNLQQGQDAELSSILIICQTLRPVLDTYYFTARRLLTISNELSTRISQLGYRLSTSFIQIATQGFCTPAETSDASTQKGDAVEAGTGLGDGEGAEDISKDVGDDEDLSEAAQGKNEADKDRELEAEKDAVDMADEEMEGELDDGVADSEMGEESGDDDVEDDAKPTEEAVQDGDDASSLQDEKTWEGAADEDQSQKDTDKGKSSKREDELAAAKGEGEENKEQGDDGDEAPEEESGSVGDDMEQPSTDNLDAEARQEEALELPDDMNFGGEADSVSGDDSDMDMLEDEPQPEPGEQEAPLPDADSVTNDEEDAEVNQDTQDAADGDVQPDESGEQDGKEQDKDTLMADLDDSQSPTGGEESSRKDVGQSGEKQTDSDMPADVTEEAEIEDPQQAWAQHEDNTRNLAFTLTEHLRLILQPTQATRLRGDFRTGKRLNIKRIIPYIASSYKRDKIWMRRSVPSKRSYQVMLAIDDSKSMAESQNRNLAFDTLALISKSMSMLEVGELSIVGFGEDAKVIHDFSSTFTSDAGVETLKQFTFAQGKTNVRLLLETSLEHFRQARMKATSSSQDLWQLQLIISDGICEDHPSIRQLVRQAHEERIMIVFIIVDAPRDDDHKGEDAAEQQRRSKQSVLDLSTAEFVKDQDSGEMKLKMVKYLDTFPFQYYLIVREVEELPGVLAAALRQWFAEVMSTGG
ncbi:hypothetical protein BDY17DRAFT_282105 [Neohortaea acidophila]|uniref:Midasin n=1 Tax=Neohortaea acidophila TaxID=245834 RepID=A0A6A6PQ77_9PEZI|nr:uncharacterized protein BDY17DRAFT_282105 [Neohortaea acidophila]KAF2481603.1 hypothetical protein BDY17DRAFT_282105 [Neohortaea acidophila]